MSNPIEHGPSLNAADRLQQEIGVDPELAEKMARFAIRCPVQGANGQYPEATFGWLMESGGHGGKLMEDKVSAAANLISLGVSPEEALKATLAGELVTNEDGSAKILTAEEAEQLNKYAIHIFMGRPTSVTESPLGPKKK